MTFVWDDDNYVDDEIADNYDSRKHDDDTDYADNARERAYAKKLDDKTMIKIIVLLKIDL